MEPDSVANPERQSQEPGDRARDEWHVADDVIGWSNVPDRSGQSEAVPNFGQESSSGPVLVEAKAALVQGEEWTQFRGSDYGRAT